MKKDSFTEMVKHLQKKIEDDEKTIYSQKVINEYKNPTNFGFIKNPDGTGRIKGSCGDSMRIDLKIKSGEIFESRFWTDGCGASIACGNMLCKIIKGKTIEEASEIKYQDLLSALDSLPKENIHCSVLAIDTLHNSLESYKNKIKGKT